MKNRIPRQAVIDAVEDFREPFTIEQLAREAKKRHPAIGRASIYRTLNKLLAAAAVRQVALPSGARIFVTPLMRASALLYCETCRTVQVLPDEELRDHIVHAMRSLGFTSAMSPVCLSVRCEAEQCGQREAGIHPHSV